MFIFFLVFCVVAGDVVECGAMGYSFQYFVVGAVVLAYLYGNEVWG